MSADTQKTHTHNSNFIELLSFAFVVIKIYINLPGDLNYKLLEMMNVFNMTLNDGGPCTFEIQKIRKDK